MFEIRFYKIVDMCSIFTNLKCIIFLLKTRFKYLNLYALFSYTGYMYNRCKKILHFTSIVCIIGVKKTLNLYHLYI